ncbi:hypothetical protein Tco_0110834 [Tanacetum coccineum]
MKMLQHEAFAYCCGKGDVVLRESYRPHTRGQLDYAFPLSKDLQHLQVGPSRNAECSNLKLLTGMIKQGNSNHMCVLKWDFNQLSTNGGTSNLTSKKVNSNGSSFWNVDSSSTSTTPIVEKIDKMKRLIIDWAATLVDYEGKPLTRVDSSGDYDSENEVASVDNDMTNFLASKDVGYGTNSLLEQWK